MRILERIEQIYAIGDRPGFSAGEQAAHDLAAGWMAEAGLAVEVDPDGNLVGRLAGEDGAEVWTGSHLDSVPNGGRYDGVLGVLAGIEAVERVGRSRKTLGVVAFRDEERGMSGSLARAAKGPLPQTFVEVHIEQGPKLLNMDAPLGVVTSIVGLARGEVTLHGAAGHAGTTPMPGRRDALVDAAELVLRVRETALAHDGCVGTVGRLHVEPGAENVIPERVTLSIDARAPDQARLDALVAALAFEPSMTTAPAQMDDTVRAILRDELEQRGLPAPELPSGAGHDTMVLAGAGVRCGMLFVRSGAGGISHSPEEHSDGADIELAVDVLASALERLATAP